MVTAARLSSDHCGDTIAQGCDPLDELAQLDALMLRLTLKRYDLKKKINRFHSPIVRQLPSEITSTIFEFCLPDFADFQPPPTRAPSKVDPCAPLSLGAICSDWREIAWSTPCLWSSLMFHITLHKRDSHTAVAREWLARSGQLPLSIRIFSNLHYPFPEGLLQTVSALADIVNQYYIRWSDFDLCVDPVFLRIFNAPNIHTPILKSIRLHASYTLNANFRLTCPLLERASLSGCRMVGTNIQWDNLTHLILQSMLVDDIFLIVRKAPRLVSCDVSCAQSQVGESSMAILTSLRSLRITGYFDEFFNNLITPFLEELIILRNYDPSMGVIRSFLERSACSLRSFSMNFNMNIPAYYEGFMHFLRSLPSLKRLSVTFDDSFEQRYNPRNILQLVAKVISSQSATPSLLPNLEVLEYTGELHLRPGNYSDLYPLPPADNSVHGPLHLFKLDLSPRSHIPKNAISYFLSLAERGVMVNVLSQSEDILQSSIEYYRSREESLCRDCWDDLDMSLMQDLS